jgi:hypothetical protein
VADVSLLYGLLDPARGDQDGSKGDQAGDDVDRDNTQGADIESVGEYLGDIRWEFV